MQKGKKQRQPEDHTGRAMDVLIMINGTTRQNIIAVLKERDENPFNIAMEMKTEPSHVAAQLSILRDYGLVSRKQKGIHKIYTLNRSRLEQIEKAIEDFNKQVEL